MDGETVVSKAAWLGVWKVVLRDATAVAVTVDRSVDESVERMDDSMAVL